MSRRRVGVTLLVIGAALGVTVSTMFSWHVRNGNEQGDRTPGQPAADAVSPAGAAEQSRRILYWRAPMDPNYRSDRPGKSPMGMDLVPVWEDADVQPGTVRVSKQFLQNFAVRSVPVTRGDLPLSIRSVGILAHNDETVISINTKYEGWIERARVNHVGEYVQQGDLLFEIYSPALMTAQQEYLAARDYDERLRRGGGHTDALARAGSLVRAARERLRHWDVSDDQIAALEAAGAPSRTLRFLAPVSGLVVEKAGDSLAGMKLTPGATVLKIADHTKLWAEAEFHEADLALVDEGSPVSINAEAFPRRRWTGKVQLFRPALNPDTRTLTALVEVANPDLVLRPMMYVDVSIEARGAQDVVLAPVESVLHSGARSMVIVDLGGGRFAPREVAPGLTGGGLQEIRSGLAPGERVVVSSQFLIDSESNLQAASAQLLRGAEPGQEADTESIDAGPTVRQPEAQR